MQQARGGSRGCRLSHTHRNTIQKHQHSSLDPKGGYCNRLKWAKPDDNDNPMKKRNKEIIHSEEQFTCRTSIGILTIFKQHYQTRKRLVHRVVTVGHIPTTRDSYEHTKRYNYFPAVYRAMSHAKAKLQQKQRAFLPSVPSYPSS